MHYLVTVIVLCLLLPVLLSSKKTYQEGDRKIIFEFSKGLKVTMLICLLFFSLLTVALSVVSIVEKDKAMIIGVIIFGIFAIVNALLCITLNNKEFVFENDIFSYKSMFGKKSSFSVKDVKEAIYKPTDCTKLVLNNGKKVKLDQQMSNYDKLREILENNNIPYKDKHGNEVPKGW